VVPLSSCPAFGKGLIRTFGAQRGKGRAIKESSWGAGLFIFVAASTGQRNTCIKSFCQRFKFQRLARSLTDRDHVRDLTMGAAFLDCLFGATDRALGSKGLRKLFFKHTADLNKQDSIDRLV
jgi:hypothetical protein